MRNQKMGQPQSLENSSCKCTQLEFLVKTMKTLSKNRICKSVLVYTRLSGLKMSAYMLKQTRFALGIFCFARVFSVQYHLMAKLL